jgi:hypothetical protein
VKWVQGLGGDTEVQRLVAEVVGRALEPDLED